MPELDSRRPAGVIYRLGRRSPGAWRFPDWLRADKLTGTFNSRFDGFDSEYRVLYACSERLGAFIEVLAYEAADEALTDELGDIDENDDSDLEYPSAPPGAFDLSEFCSKRSVGIGRATADAAYATMASPANVEALSSCEGSLDEAAGILDESRRIVQGHTLGSIAALTDGRWLSSRRVPAAVARRPPRRYRVRDDAIGHAR